MSNTRKVRRARKARERAEFGRLEAEARAQFHKEKSTEIESAFFDLHGEWQYHSDFMREIAPDKHSAVFAAKPSDIKLDKHLVEHGYNYSPESFLDWANFSLSDNSVPTIASTAIAEMRTMRVAIKSDRDLYREKLTHYIHMVHSHGDNQVYAYSSTMEGMVRQESLVHRVLNELIDYAKRQFYKSSRANP